MTTPAHELGLYFTSRDLAADGEPLPDRTVVSASPLQITTSSITQPTGYWDGAIGFFTENAPDVLKGFFFHVRTWTAGADDNPGTLQLYGSLPVPPPSGTVFRLCKGGKYASSQEIPGLMVSGKQPEFNPVTHSSIPGISITKASPGLGEGTLTLRSQARSISVQITTATGYGSPVQLTENAEGLILYTGGAEGWVRVNVEYSKTSSSNVTGTFTLQIPKGVLVPDVEVDDAADPNGRLRYFCVAAKNDSETETLSALGAWTSPPGTETATVLSVSGETITLQEEPTSWPLKGFWVRKSTNNTYRYVVNRAGKILHLKALSRASYDFRGGNHNLVLGDTLRWNSATGNSLGKLLDIRIVSGSLADGNAVVSLLTTNYQSLSNNNSNGAGIYVYNERTKASACYLGTYTSTGARCDRAFTAPGTWTSNDLLEPVSDLDIAAVLGDEIDRDPVSVTEKPKVDMNFRPGPTIDERAIAGYLGPGDKALFWVQQHILPNVPAHSAVTGAVNFSWY